MTIKTINPLTEEVIYEYSTISKEEIENIAKTSKEAFRECKKDYNKRADYLYAFAGELRKNKENLAKVATNEVGKAIKESRSEVDKCAWAIEYFADNSNVFLTDEVINTDANVTIGDIVKDNDKITCRYTTRGTHKGELMGIPPSNKSIKFSGITLLHFKNGKCVERWTQADFQGMLKQIVPVK